MSRSRKAEQSARVTPPIYESGMNTDDRSASTEAWLKAMGDAGGQDVRLTISTWVSPFATLRRAKDLAAPSSG